jgi:cell division protein ZapA (FtsZ GTPase activity inhibitor)
MSSVSIKIVIAGRTYPLTVGLHEEENIRAAAKKIEESLLFFQQNYAVRDKQDLLAMAALQFATESVQTKSENADVADLKLLRNLDQELEYFLNTTQN